MKTIKYSALEAGADFYCTSPVDSGWCRAQHPWTEHWADGSSATYNAYTPWGPDWFGPSVTVEVAR